MPFHPECSHHFNAHSGTFTLAPRTLAPNHDIAWAVQHAGRRRLCASPTSPADIPGERRGNCHSGPVRVGNGRQIFVNRHSRQLASRERVGRFSRGIAWDLITSFARRHWIILLAALFLPIVAFLPLFFLEHGAARWITVGAAGISGPWIVAVMTILMSGAADPFIGLDAEASTADELRRLRRHGWKLANGIKIREKEDIDHLVVGPAGLLVVESKWSRHRWPLGDQSQSFMSARLSDAVAQVLRNRKDVSTQFAKALDGTPLRAVCVIWSAEDSSGDPPWIEFGDAVVVRGPALKSWLRSLAGGALDEPGIDRVWKEIEHQASVRDENDRKRSGPPRPTMARVVVESFLAPFLGAVLALYGLVAVGLAHQTWLDVAGPFLFAAVGIAVLRIAFLRRAALGWIGISLGFVLILLVFMIRDLIK